MARTFICVDTHAAGTHTDMAALSRQHHSELRVYECVTRVCTVCIQTPHAIAIARFPCLSLNLSRSSGISINMPEYTKLFK